MVGEDQFYRDPRGQSAVARTEVSAPLFSRRDALQILENLQSSRIIRSKRMILIEPRLAQRHFARPQK
jgi:hypothetical protein